MAERAQKLITCLVFNAIDRGLKNRFLLFLNSIEFVLLFARSITIVLNLAMLCCPR